MPSDMYHHGGSKSLSRAVMLSVTYGAAVKKDGSAAFAAAGEDLVDLAPRTLDTSTYSVGE